MEIIGVIGYLIACLVVAALITVVIGLFRPIRKHDEFRSWRYTLGLFVFAVFAPYAYAEVMTRIHGTKMTDAVKQVLPEAEIKGKLAYYKVLACSSSSAKVIAVAEESSGWGPKEHAVMAIDLVKEAKGWKAKEFTIVNSFKRGKDGTTIPPYW